MNSRTINSTLSKEVFLMTKRPWKECSCGVITDPDEEKCPERGLEDCKHQLRPIKLSDAELINHWHKGRKIYTKDRARFDALLKER